MHALISVPASSANLGPGFDCLGVALPMRLFLRFRTRPGPLRVTLRGEGADELPADASNLVVRSMLDGVAADGFVIEIRNQLPLAAGCGSSAAAIVAGMAARQLLQRGRVELDELFCDAVAVEGHPDNVAAAILGGFTIAAGTPPVLRRVQPPSDLAFVLVVPPERLATQQARAALAASARHADAVYNVQRVALLVSALYTGCLADLGPALDDRLHQDARAHLVPTFAQLHNAKERVDALGVTLSGAGPSVLVWCRAADAAACARRVADEAPQAQIRVLRPEPRGLLVRTHPDAA